MDDRTRFTTEQVLRGIQAFVFDEVDEKLIIDSEASVNDYRDAITKSHECPLFFLTELAAYFGFRHGEDRWIIWLSLNDTKRWQGWEHWQDVTSKALTVRKLAEHIARYAPGTSMAPVTVFGVHCAPAGAFRGICELPEIGGRRIAPSTPIAKTLGGSRIIGLWNRAAWISGVRLPPLKRTPWWSLTSISNWIDAIGFGFASVATVTTLLGVGIATTSFWFALLTAVVMLFALLVVTHQCSDAVHNPLPEGVVTFGDLARLVAEKPVAA